MWSQLLQSGFITTDTLNDEKENNILVNWTRISKNIFREELIQFFPENVVLCWIADFQRNFLDWKNWKTHTAEILQDLQHENKSTVDKLNCLRDKKKKYY